MGLCAGKHASVVCGEAETELLSCSNTRAKDQREIEQLCFSPNFSQMDFKVSDKSVSRLRVLLSLN